MKHSLIIENNSNLRRSHFSWFSAFGSASLKIQLNNRMSFERQFTFDGHPIFLVRTIVTFALICWKLPFVHSSLVRKRVDFSEMCKTFTAFVRSVWRRRRFSKTRSSRAPTKACSTRTPQIVATSGCVRTKSSKIRSFSSQGFRDSMFYKVNSVIAGFWQLQRT